MNIKSSTVGLIVLLFSLSCNSGKNKLKESIEIDSIALLNQQKENDNIESKAETQSDYDSRNIKMIDSKQEIRELDGNFNQMILFEVKEDINVYELKEYCSSVKSKYSNGYFQILVFFKKPNTARFPNNPITGMYME